MHSNKTIYRFDALKLYNLGYKDNDKKMIICDSLSSNYSKIEIEKSRNSLLFDQLDQVLDLNDNYSENIIVIDFSNFIREYRSIYKKFINYENGIEIVINNKKIVFIPFIKSNSMSRLSRAYYINNKLYEKIKDRITFGFDKFEVDISKWFSYSGLIATDSKLVDLELNENNVCIIPDLEKEIKIDVITAISINSLFDDIKKLDKILKRNIIDNGEAENDKLLININNARNIINKFDSYKNSIDFDNLKHKELIDNLANLKNKTVMEVLAILKEYKNNIYIENPVKWEKINIKDSYVTSNIFDGTGLIDTEYMNIINEALNGNYNSIQFRMPFTKGMLHSVNLKEFFEEEGIQELDSIINFKSYDRYDTKKILAKDVKIILTVGQFKAAKFLQHLTKEEIKKYGCNSQIEYYFKKLKEYKYKFGIANVEFQKSEYALNYQFLSTLPLTKNVLDELCNNTYNVINKNVSEDVLIESIKDNDYYKGDILIHEIARDFYIACDRYKDLRDKTLSSYIKEALACKVYTKSRRRYLAPDLLALMYYSYEWNTKKDSYLYEANKLKLNYIYLPKYDDEEDNSIVLRNPHYSRNEIGIYKILKNVSDIREKYLGHLSGIVMSNYENLLADRLGGADYDGDSVLILTDNNLVDTVSRQFLKISKDNIINIYPIAKIPSLSSSSKILNYKNIIECFDNTFKNNVGIISNIAITKSIDIYDGIVNDTLNNEYDPKYDDIAFYTILSGLEIDSVKNGFKPFFAKTSNKFDYLNIKDELLDIDNNSELKKKFKNIDNKKNHPAIYVYNKMLEVISNLDFKAIDKENLKKAKEKYKIAKKDEESLITAKAVVDSIVTKNKYVEKRKSYLEKEQTDIYISVINDILSSNKNTIDINEIINKLRDNDSYELLLKYLNKYQDYIFLKNDDDKINFINELGINNLNDNEIKALINFNNRGYNLLFLLLKLSAINIDDNLYNYLVNEYELKDDDNYNDDYLIIHNKIIHNVIDYSLNLSSFELKKKVDEYIKKYIMNHYDIDFESLANVVDIYKYELIYTIFFNATYKYFEKNGDKNE